MAVCSPKEPSRTTADWPCVLAKLAVMVAHCHDPPTPILPAGQEPTDTAVGVTVSWAPCPQSTMMGFRPVKNTCKGMTVPSDRVIPFCESVTMMDWEPVAELPDTTKACQLKAGA